MKINFQYIVLGAFIFFAVAGIFLFSISGKFGGGGNESTQEVTIWGTRPEREVRELLSRIDNKNPNLVKIKYTEIREEFFDETLLEALASDKGPDMIFLSDDRLIKYKDKIFPIPYDSLSQRDFRNIFITEGELYLGAEGVYAVPFSVDPLVMYWNRATFAGKGEPLPPSYWDEFFTLSPKLTEIDNSRNILKSFVAFGEYDNVNNAKEILSALLLQAGNPITTVQNDRLISAIGNKSADAGRPAESVLRFFTEFSNPVKAVYSWNKAKPLSAQAFLGGDLALYLGFASEASSLRQKNPNLDFDVTLLPQIRDADLKATYAKIEGLAVLKSSPRLASSISAIFVLIAKDNIFDWAEITNLPPVRRDLLKDRPEEAFKQIFYDSALISKGWLDPDSEQTGIIFGRMVKDVTSGRLKISEAVDRASSEMTALLR